MKDEYGGKSMLKFVGLMSKMYSILDESNNEKITSKGRNVLQSFKNFTIHYLKKDSLTYNGKNRV